MNVLASYNLDIKQISELNSTQNFASATDKATKVNFNQNPTSNSIDRTVEPITLEDSISGVRDILMPMIPHIINGNAAALAASWSATDLTNLLKSGAKSAIAFSILQGGEHVINEGKIEGEEKTDLGKLVFKPMLASNDTTTALFTISTPILNYTPNNKYIKNFTSPNAQVYVRITRPSLNSDGSEFRMVEISLRKGVKTKLVSNYDVKGSKKIATGKVKTFNIAGWTDNSNIRLVTTPERLESILLGKEPFPDIFTGKNLSTKDIVTIDGSDYYLGTSEIRATDIEFASKKKNKKISKATKSTNKSEFQEAIEGISSGLGVSTQGVLGKKVGQRIVVQMGTAKDGSQRAMLFSGTSLENKNSVLAGGIVNPTLSPAAQKYTGMSTGYIRALGGDEDVANENRLNWVEVDLSTKKGRNIYKRAVKTGYIPIAEMGEKISGTLAHGQLIFNSERNAKIFKFTEYFHKSLNNILTPTSKTKIVGQETVLSQFIEPKTEINMNRYFIAKNVDDNSILKEQVRTTTNQGGEHLYSFPYDEGIGVKHLERYTDNAMVSDININTKDFSEKNNSMKLLALRASKIKVIDSLQKEIDTKDIKTFKSINLYTPKGKIMGQEAIDYLRTNSAPSNASAYGDEVKTVISLENKESVDKFFNNFKADLKKYHTANNSSWASELIDKAEYKFGEYGLVYLDADNIELAKKIEKLETPTELGSNLMKTEFGDFTNLLTQIGGEYPIKLDLYVDY